MISWNRHGHPVYISGQIPALLLYHSLRKLVSHPVDRAVPAVVWHVAGGVPLAAGVGERVGVKRGRGRAGRRRLAAAVARVVLKEFNLGEFSVIMISKYFRQENKTYYLISCISISNIVSNTLI